MEKYEGVKFRTIFNESTYTIDARLEELKHWCQQFHTYKLAPPYEGGSAGNLSFRKMVGQKNFIITGTKIGLKCSLSAKQFVEVLYHNPSTGEVFVNGAIEPSSESMLHGALYELRPDIQAIFHGHSEQILNKFAELKIPVTPHAVPYGTLELVTHALDLARNTDFFILKDHGFVSMGKSMHEAGQNVLDILQKLS